MPDTLGSSPGLSGIPRIWKPALPITLSLFQFERLAALSPHFLPLQFVMFFRFQLS